MADWAWLPEGILDLVLSKLIPLQDYISFSCVCKSWHDKAEEQRHSRIASCEKQVPLLLIPTKTRSKETRSLYSSTNDKLLQSQLRIPYHRRCCGSSHGWLAFVEKDYSVTLYNPFTQAETSLPPIGNTGNLRINQRHHQRHFPSFAHKVILSADPFLHRDEYVAAGLITDPFRTLVVIRPGRDIQWRRITSDHQKLPSDLIFDKSGKWVYTSGEDGSITRANIDEQNPVSELVVAPWIPAPVGLQMYLVETTTCSNNNGGDMLMILRESESRDWPNDIDRVFVVTKDIKVFKLRNSTLVEVDHLDGNAVFVGDNCSTAVLARDFPDVVGDWIYYTDDFTEFPCHYLYLGPREIGKYNVKDKQFDTHYVPSRSQNRKMPPPVWIFPTLKPIISSDLGWR